MSIDNSTQWQELLAHAKQMKKIHLADLITSNNRINDFSLEMNGMYVDFSKNRINLKTLQLLENLANKQDLDSWIKKLFTGKKINNTENRAALHTALRATPSTDNIIKQSIQKDISNQLVKMEQIVNKIRQGHWRGATGKAITDVINIGVGGSDLGPLMITHALQATESPIKLHFISAIDGTQTSNILKQLNQDTTLFILASKSFTTLDTLSNAKTAIYWLKERINFNVKKQHFIGISTSIEKMTAWGIAPQNQLLFWDWVGGRYSMWSTIGLPIALKLGMDGFKDFLAGANEMDQHFLNKPFKQNIPVKLALIDVWNINFLDIQKKAILPYDARLKFLPAYLSQLVMESNGKSVDRQGNSINYKTCPVLWGEVGSNAQHAFYQLLHQGTQKVMSDFIAINYRDDFDSKSEEQTEQSLQEQHALSLANCFAQSRVLMLGNKAIPKKLTHQFNSPYKRYAGNQTSNTILLDDVSANSLGKLIALYEHKTFVEAVIWDINPFDQWGVELGKTIATETKLAMEEEILVEDFDCSTKELLRRVKT